MSANTAKPTPLTARRQAEVSQTQRAMKLDADRKAKRFSNQLSYQVGDFQLAARLMQRVSV